ncbi:MAG: hypothetical protein WB992_07725 [Bryobacteraceae bacterium]
MDEHQPQNPTENLLIHDMAQSHWLTQRALRLQNECFTADGVDQKSLTLYLRYYTTHERAFHKALNTLMKLKKERMRGFVPQSAHVTRKNSGFVPQNQPEAMTASPDFEESSVEKAEKSVAEAA